MNNACEIFKNIIANKINYCKILFSGRTASIDPTSFEKVVGSTLEDFKDQRPNIKKSPDLSNLEEWKTFLDDRINQLERYKRYQEVVSPYIADLNDRVDKLQKSGKNVGKAFIKFMNSRAYTDVNALTKGLS